MIYLASPYTDPDPAVRQQRYEATARAVIKLFNEGNHVFSPIAYVHPLVTNFETLGEGLSQWLRFDFSMLRRCDSLVVLRLDGWQQSKGVAAEIAFAGALKKPVRFL